MAKFQFKGVNEYAEQLTRLSNKSVGMIKRAVYEGAAVVADTVRTEIQALPEVDVNPKPGEQMNGVFSYEKAGLLEGVGLSGMKNEGGYINTKLGFTGYNRLKSRSYPNGHPNALIARSIESGSSVRRRIPFVSSAVKAAKGKAEAAMKAQLEADLTKETK